jgi:hypothetical protein
MGGWIGIEKVEGADEIAFPLGVAVLDAAEQFGEMIAIDPIVKENTVNHRHQPHATLLEVVQRAV